MIHKGSVMSPLLFMDVDFVTELWEGMLSELL